MTRSLPFVFVLLVLLHGGAAQSQVELLANGNLDSDLAGWDFVPSAGASTMTWDPMDVDASQSSGAIRVEIDPVDIGNGGRPVQCVDVRGGGSYDFGAWVFIPSSAVMEQNFVRVQWKGAAGCDGDNLGSDDTTSTQIQDAWVRLQRTDIVAPLDARSAEVSLVVFEDSALMSNRTVFWDAASFVPEPHNALTAIAVLCALGALAGRIRLGRP